MTNDATTSLRLPDPIRAEMRRRIQAGEFKTRTDLVLRALTEYFDHHPGAPVDDLPYDHGDHGSWTGLNELRAQAANDLEAAINLTVAAHTVLQDRPRAFAQAALARKFAASSQAEYTIACWDRREDDRGDFNGF